AWRGELFALGGRVPDANINGSGGDETLAVLSELDGDDAITVAASLKNVTHFGVAGLPHADGAIAAGRCQPFTVGRKGHGVDGTGVRLDNRPFLLQIQVPELDDAVVTARNERLAVRGEGDAGGPAAVH